MEVLRLCFPANLRHALEELPKSLDETYKRILNEINNANRVHAYRLLQCLAVALRPLRVEELAEVLAFDLTTGGIPKLNADWRWEDQEEAVLSACSSLVSVIIDDHGSRVVQFSHFSVKEFLTSDRLASSLEEMSKFHIPGEHSHALLAQACLGVFLCLDDHTDEDSVEKVPLCRYATRYWAEHAQVGDVESQIKDALDYFFDMDNPHFSALVRLKHKYDLLRLSEDEDPTGVPRPAAPLYFAAWMGLHGLVERLIIKNPQHVNQLGGVLGTPLHASLHGGHIEVFKLLLAHGADVNLCSGDNWSPLHVAINTRHLEIAKWLLNRGADVNSQENAGRTPLHFASTDLEACRMLLEHNAEVDLRSNNGYTPLLSAWRSRGRNPDILQLFLEHNADVHAFDVASGRYTPLHFAAENGHLKFAQTLLERNVEVDPRRYGGTTPFLGALHCGHPDVAQLLLDHSANVHVHDEKGYSPLHLAAINGLLEVSQILLERNADVNSQNNNGSTPLLLASEFGHPDVVQLLLDHKADLYLRNFDGDNPLLCAALGGRLEVAQLLLKLNVDVNSQNNHGSTPLLLASEIGHPDVVQLFLDHKADLYLCDSDGDTPLHCAAAGGQLEVALLLLRLNVEVNSRNVEGSTPLHLASRGSWSLRKGSAVVVRLLLDHGADVQARDLSGKTASEVARGPEQQEIVRLLSQDVAE